MESNYLEMIYCPILVIPHKVNIKLWSPFKMANVI